MQDEANQFDVEKFKTSFHDKVVELKKVFGNDYSRFDPLIESFRVNIPLDNKQAIEDTFESTLCHDLLKVLDPKMGEYLH